MYEYLKMGQVYGPVSAAELLDLAESGALGPDDRVRELGDFGDRSVADVVALLRTVRLVEGSQPAPRLTRSSLPGVGAHTVFGSVPPLPPNPLPRFDAGLTAHCTHADNPRDARFCVACGATLAR